MPILPTARSLMRMGIPLLIPEPRETTTTTSTAVPYSFEYGIYTLSVERQQKDGSYLVLHRFQQKGIYRTLYGVPLGGKGHHPAHAVIEEAAQWISWRLGPSREICAT